MKYYTTVTEAFFSGMGSFYEAFLPGEPLKKPDISSHFNEVGKHISHAIQQEKNRHASLRG